MVKKFFKKSKSKKLIKRNKISRKHLRGGDQGLEKIENIQVDRIPNGIFNKMDSYISNKLYIEDAGFIKLLLSALLNKKSNFIEEADGLDNLYLNEHADVNNNKFCWYVIDKKNLYVDIIFNEKQFGLEWYLKHDPNDLMNELARRGKQYNYNYSLIYYHKIINDKNLLFRVDVKVINKKVSFEIFLLDKKGNKITIPVDTGYINISPNNNTTNDTTTKTKPIA